VTHGRTVILTLSLLFLCSGLYAEEHKAAEEFNLNEVLVHHLMDAPIIEWNLCLANTTFKGYDLCGKKVYQGTPEFANDSYRRYTFQDADGKLYKYQGGIPLHITKRVAMMWIVALFLILVLGLAGRIIAKDPFRIGGRFAGIIEAIVQYMREEVVDKNMHHEKGFQSFILTLFFFILFSNLLGLFPPFGEIAHSLVSHFSGHGEAEHAATVPGIVGFWPGITVTGDVGVTATLAIITTIMIWAVGFRYQGIGFLWSCIPHDMPLIVALSPIGWLLFIIEIIIGPFAKGFALAIRLLANMTAGHVIIIALLGFIFQFRTMWFFIVPVSVAGSGAIYLLEVMVAFLQAYIFTLLTALFVGASMHRH